ncbi:MAG TPA: 5-(carboxyamino)imidazole ribonucleotide synthase [Opitutaceae bacterium]
MIAPGQTIGIVGGGQLGRMLAQAAQTLGYRVAVFDPDANCPASSVCHGFYCGSYDDAAALEGFAAVVDVLTYEFENISADALRSAASRVPLRPTADVLHVCQNRQREKAWLKSHGFPHVAYTEALDGDIRAAAQTVGLPCVIKTADFGYDGKGQMRVGSEAELEQAAAIFRGRRCVVEQWAEFSCELSVIVARAAGGETRAFPVAENQHARHILDLSIIPARVPKAVATMATELSLLIADTLDVVGLLAVELFVLDDGTVLVNELAPRPHNSGHWSLDGADTSQFEQHVRAICGLPLGSPVERGPIVMANILGDAWKDGTPNWSEVLRTPRAKLHLYGKDAPRPGRKMGHFTVSAASADLAIAEARRLQGLL